MRTHLNLIAGIVLGLVLSGCGAPPTATTSAVGMPAAATLPASTSASSAQPTPATPTAAPTATALPTAIPTATPVPLASLTVSRDLGYVPILMYHYIRSVDEAADPLGFRLSVTPERFDEQMAWLKQNGYTTLRMAELAACLRAEQPCPEKPVALTFDDGYADAATEALPTLKRYGFTATFYIATSLIGQPGYMTWEQVRLMHEQGMEIGAHTVNHVELTGLSSKQAEREIVESRAVLKRETGASVLSFCYPAGKNSPEIAMLVRDAGFSSAVTTDIRDGFGNLFQLGRRRVLGGESIKGYPWYFQPLQ